MKTSIVVTSFCRADYLKWWFHSLVKWGLRGLDCEILVVNDGFRDETKDVADYYRSLGYDVRYFFTGHRNVYPSSVLSRAMGYAANVGIRQARGDILILSNCDIYHINDTVRPIIDAVYQNPKALATIGTIHDDRGDLINLLNALNGPVTDDVQWRINNVIGDIRMLDPLPGAFRSHRDQPFMLGMRRNRLLDLGGYDEDFYGYACEDCDLMFRLQDAGCHYVYTSGECVHLYHGRKTDEEVEPLAAFQYNYNLMQSRRGQLVRNQHREWGRWMDQPDKQPPLHLAIYATTQCNLDCPLCSQARLRNENPNYHMSLEEVDHFIESCLRRGIHFREVEITGGEPTLWRHFEEGVKRIYESHVADDVSFVTNGNNPELAVEVSTRYAPWYFVSLQQATPQQAHYHRRHGARPLWNTEVHRPPPTRPYPETLPCQCGATISRWGERCIGLSYFHGTVFYCGLAPSLQYITNPDPQISVPFDEDFITHFSNKKFDRPICAMCLDNQAIWRRI